MGYFHRPFEFKDDVPELVAVVEAANNLSEVLLVADWAFGPNQVSVNFTNMGGGLTVQRSRKGIVFSGPTGCAPVLGDLLDLSIRSLGGESKYDSPKPELPSPLRMEDIASLDKIKRRELNRLLLPYIAVFAGILVLAVALVASIIYWIRHAV